MVIDERLSRDDTGRVTSDYEPTPTEIEVCRDAICREFGNNGTDGYYIRILKAVHAAASLRAQGGVRVKPLEWAKFEGLDPSIYRERAVTSFGVEYHISKEGWWQPLCKLNKCDNIEAAKAAAQADYGRRILSSLTAALSVKPQSVPDPENMFHPDKVTDHE